MGEIETIVEFAKSCRSSSDTYPLYHIDSPARVKRYVDKADEIIRHVPHGRILDWGSGYGQMVFLLHKRGADVAGCEFSEHYKQGTLADLLGKKIIYLTDAAGLPFDDMSFDAVLSCGVLEHVENPDASLKEISRILKKQGYFFIYNLPNRFSWMEFVSRHTLGGGHERLYDLGKISKRLESYGFVIIKKGYEGFLPVNLGFAAGWLRRLVDNPSYNSVDQFFSNMPPLKYFCQNLALICCKE